MQYWFKRGISTLRHQAAASLVGKKAMNSSVGDFFRAIARAWRSAHAAPRKRQTLTALIRKVIAIPCTLFLTIASKLCISSAYLLGMGAIAFVALWVTSLFYDVQFFILDFVVVAFSIFFITVSFFSAIPYLRSAKSRSDQDVAFLIAGLAALITILDVQTTLLNTVQSNLSLSRASSTADISNIKSIAREECSSHP